MQILLPATATRQFNASNVCLSRENHKTNQKFVKPVARILITIINFPCQTFSMRRKSKYTYDKYVKFIICMPGGIFQLLRLRWAHLQSMQFNQSAQLRLFFNWQLLGKCCKCCHIVQKLAIYSKYEASALITIAAHKVSRIIYIKFMDARLSRKFSFSNIFISNLNINPEGSISNLFS